MVKDIYSFYCSRTLLFIAKDQVNPLMQVSTHKVTFQSLKFRRHALKWDKLLTGWVYYTCHKKKRRIWFNIFLLHFDKAFHWSKSCLKILCSQKGRRWKHWFYRPWQQSDTNPEPTDWPVTAQIELRLMCSGKSQQKFSTVTIKIQITSRWTLINSRGSPFAHGGSITSPSLVPFCLQPKQKEGKNLDRSTETELQQKRWKRK